MRQYLWPLSVVAAFGLGLGASSFHATGPATHASPEELPALVRRLQAQVSTLQARLRAGAARLTEPLRAATGQAMASLERSAATESAPVPRARSARSPQGEPQDDLSAPTRVAKAAAPSGTTAPATVEAALDRFYRYLDGNRGTGPARWRQTREAVAELRAMGDAGTEALSRVLASGSSSEERRTAAQLLGEVQDPRAAAALQDVLDKDGDVLLRRAAAGALRRLESPETIPVLDTLLANPADDRFVRMSAALGLAKMGQPQGITGLMQIFDESNADGRGRDMAFRALNSLNDDRTLPFMRQVAASGAEPGYRMQAIRFLTAQGDQQSLPALQQIMQSPTEQPSIRDAAGQAFAAISSRR